MNLKNTLIYLLVLVYTLQVSCTKEKEIEIIHTPIALKALSASDITESQVTLYGQIQGSTKEEIVDIGFIIYESNMNNDESIVKEISLGKQEIEIGKTVNYTWKKDNIFDLDLIYSYVFYVKTLNGFYKSEPIHFEINQIKLDENTPIIATLDETISIEGNFKQITDLHFITFNENSTNRIPIQLNENKSKLTLTLPKNGYVHGNQIEVILNKQSKSDNSFFIKQKLITIKIAAKITGLKKYKVAFNDLIEIVGTGLPSYGDPNLILYIGDQKINYYNPTFTLSQIQNLKGKSYLFGYNNGRDSIIFSQKIELEQPNGNTLNFSEKAHHGSFIFVDNFDFYRHFGNKQLQSFLGNTAINTQYEIYSNRTSFRIPSEIPEGKYNLKFKGEITEITSSKTIEIIKFDWKSINKKSFYIGDTIQLNGKFFKNNSYSVLITSLSQFIPISSYDGYIKFALPKIKSGTHQIRAQYNDNNGLYNINQSHVETFEVKMPIINSVITKKESFDYTRTIVQGKGLDPSFTFFIGNVQVPTSFDFYNGSSQNVELYNLPIIPGKYKVWMDTGFGIVESPNLLEIQ